MSWRVFLFDPMICILFDTHECFVDNFDGYSVSYDKLVEPSEDFEHSLFITHAVDIVLAPTPRDVGSASALTLIRIETSSIGKWIKANILMAKFMFERYRNL